MSTEKPKPANPVGLEAASKKKPGRLTEMVRGVRQLVTRLPEAAKGCMGCATMVAAMFLMAVLGVAYILWILKEETEARRLMAPFRWVLEHPPSWPLATIPILVALLSLFFTPIESFLKRLKRAPGLEASDSGQVSGQTQTPEMLPEGKAIETSSTAEN